MDEYMRKCERCEKVKPITDFPLELMPVNPQLTKYCVPCGIKIMELINR